LGVHQEYPVKYAESQPPSAVADGLRVQGFKGSRGPVDE
jgi:hypothetical protein